MERRYLNSALLEGVVLQNPMTISPESAGNLIVRFDVECDNSRPSADGKHVDDSATVPVIAIGDFGKEVLNVIRADHVEFMRDGVRVVIDGSDVQLRMAAGQDIPSPLWPFPRYQGTGRLTPNQEERRRTKWTTTYSGQQQEGLPRKSSTLS